MNTILGIRERDGESTSSEALRAALRNTEQFAHDCTSLLTDGCCGMAAQEMRSGGPSTSGSCLLHIPSFGIVAFDGRLDNYDELTDLLSESEDCAHSDVSLVARAFIKWGEACFSRLRGDWALAIWARRTNRLYLARDHAGTRSLYFKLDGTGVVRWGTYLESLITTNVSRAELSHGYAAMFMSGLPIRDNTPYRFIKSVKAGHSVVIDSSGAHSFEHWSPIRHVRPTHRSDVDYEAEFVRWMKVAVERRIKPGVPFIAHLSGGMDSTSIVCIADYLKRASGAGDPIETVSYYDNSDPSWNDQEYFTAVESMRGRTGLHIEDSLDQFDIGKLALDGALPAPAKDRWLEVSKYGPAYRAIISGIGGDELLGGVPSALPELADYLVGFKLGRFLTASYKWCLPTRRPLWFMLRDVCAFAWQLYIEPPVRQVERETQKHVPPWLLPSYREVCVDLSIRGASAGRLRDLSPTEISNSITWWRILETLPHLYQGSTNRYEYRYPYLDRDLVEFLLSIPRDQLIRPGQRRSLMKRALKGYVPDIILERKQKAYRLRGPMVVLQRSRPYINELFKNSILADLQIIDPVVFMNGLDSTINGDPRWWAKAMKTIVLEMWLHRRVGSTNSNNWCKRQVLAC